MFVRLDLRASTFPLATWAPRTLPRCIVRRVEARFSSGSPWRRLPGRDPRNQGPWRSSKTFRKRCACSIPAVRPQLDPAVPAIAGFRTRKPIELTEVQENAEAHGFAAAEEELKKNPPDGLVLLARIAAGGRRQVAHQIARIIARGDYGVQPDAVLAKRFHHAAPELLERDAEYGDMNPAHRLGLYALGLRDMPDVPAALRWLSYAAELGNSSAAERLAQLYTDGAPSIFPDVKQATRWAAFAEATGSDDFKPRAPLR